MASYTYTVFWEKPGGTVEPLYDIPIPALNFPTAEAAREVALKIVNHPDISAHSLTIQSDDGAVSERWFVMDGTWRRRDD